MGQTFTVSNAAELSEALADARGGDRIELESGNYGELQMTGRIFSDEGLTITSADPDDMAVFDKIGLYRSENVHFDRIEIDFDPVGNEGYKVAFRAAQGDEISLTNSVLQGGVDPDRPAEFADAPVGLGVQIQRTDNVTIEGNDISDFHAGVGVAYVTGLKVNDNHIYDMRTSPLAGGGVSDVEVIGNHFESSNPIGLGGSGDHGDMVHFYPLTYQDRPMENIIIKDNFFEQGTNPDSLLGIYIDDAGSGGAGIGYSNVVIENNVIHNGDAQGIRVENVDGLRIVDNSLLQSSGWGMGQAPGIVLTSGTENVIIDNNIIGGIISGSSRGDPSVVIGDNVFVQDRDPFGENYVGDLFVNGLTRNGDIEDLMPLEGSVAEGYGADISIYDLPQGANVALISDVRGDGLDMKTISFDVEALYGTEGPIDISTAELTWDFGDGTTGTGDEIQHTYDTAGAYDVTVTFAFDNGETVSVDKTVDVFTPDAVILDFEDGIADVSDFENRVNTLEEVRLEAGRFGDALRLVENTSKVEVRPTEEITDNPNFTISLAFQKDGGTETNSDNGMFVYYSGTAYLSTGEGSVRFGGVTSTGRTIQLSAEAEQIEDGNWHHLTYTFSSDDRSAVLYLDGEEVDRMDNLTGIQHSTAGHNLLLGGRVGGAFGGLMDEVEFTRAALTPEEVRERYEDLFEEETDESDAAPLETVVEGEADVSASDDASGTDGSEEPVSGEEPQDVTTPDVPDVIDIVSEQISAVIDAPDVEDEAGADDEAVSGDDVEVEAEVEAEVGIERVFCSTVNLRDANHSKKGIFAPEDGPAAVEDTEIAPVTADVDAVQSEASPEAEADLESHEQTVSEEEKFDELLDNLADMLGLSKDEEGEYAHTDTPDYENYDSQELEDAKSLFGILTSTGTLSEQLPDLADEEEDVFQYQESDNFIF